MYLLKKVGNRTEGMGWKLIKFHGILHMAEDIKMFGVPMVVDTGASEGHHKKTKVAAKLTQKNITTFETQTDRRLEEMHLLDLALHEVAGRPLWDYFDGFASLKPTQSAQLGQHTAQMRGAHGQEEGRAGQEGTYTTGGSQIRVKWSAEKKAATWKMLNFDHQN